MNKIETIKNKLYYIYLILRKVIKTKDIKYFSQRYRIKKARQKFEDNN